MSFEEAVVRVHDGTLGFDEFVQQTQEVWRSLANKILQRWKAPCWVSEEDVVQDLLLAAWSFVWRYDPSRSTSHARFVVWNACDKAKKNLHKVRGAGLSGSPDKRPSRIEKPFSAMGERAEAWAANKLSAPAEQEERYDRLERAEAFIDGWPPKEAHAVRALVAAGGSVARGAQVLYDDTDARLDCRLSCEERAAELVQRVAEAVLAAAA